MIKSQLMYSKNCSDKTTITLKDSLLRVQSTKKVKVDTHSFIIIIWPYYYYCYCIFMRSFRQNINKTSTILIEKRANYIK